MIYSSTLTPPRYAPTTLRAHHASRLTPTPHAHPIRSYVVVDEADRMLDLGFEPQLRGLLHQVPACRLTITISCCDLQ